MQDISSTYFHNMSVSRITETEDQWGGTVQKYAPVPALQLVPCAYSVDRRTSPNTTQTEIRNVIEYSPKVFCDPSLVIMAGDRIEIRGYGRVIGKFQASEPYIYSSHQEIVLEKFGEA